MILNQFRLPLIDKINQLLKEWNISDIDISSIDTDLCNLGIHWKLYPTKSWSGFSKSILVF